jgi:putative FmdB family regulatory protein
MPIYAFECTRCGHRFDRLQRLSDTDPTVCPICAVEGEVRRQLTAPSFRLAGGGWYETDFKKDGDKKRNLAEKAEGGGKPEASTGGGDGAKPASTGDAKPAPAPAPAAPAGAAPAPKPPPSSGSKD